MNKIFNYLRGKVLLLKHNCCIFAKLILDIMSKKFDRKKHRFQIDQNKIEINVLARKYNWKFCSQDLITHRISFIDELKIYRMDVFVTTFTIGLLPLGLGTFSKWYRRKDITFLEEMFKHPTVYETC